MTLELGTSVRWVLLVNVVVDGVAVLACRVTVWFCSQHCGAAVDRRCDVVGKRERKGAVTDVGATHNLVPAQLLQVMGTSRLEPAFTAQSHHWNATTNCCANQATELDDNLSVQAWADNSSRWNYNGDQAESAAAHITCQGVTVANQQLGCAKMCQRCLRRVE